MKIYLLVEDIDNGYHAHKAYTSKERALKIAEENNTKEREEYLKWYKIDNLYSGDDWHVEEVDIDENS